MKQQVVLIHGGNAFKTYKEYLRYLKNYKLESLESLKKNDWKISLGKKLGKNYEVIFPIMPNSKNARYLEWKIWFEKIIPFFKPWVILVGHSLGGIFLTKYFSENTINKKVKALLLVAPPYNTAKVHPIADFIIKKDLNIVTEKVKDVTIYFSKDDKVVPFTNCKHFQKNMPKANFEIFNNRGHFNQDNFPEIVKLIKKLS